MQWSLVFLFIFGLATSSPIDSNVSQVLSGEKSALIEGQLRNALEDLRKTMVEGSDDVPILDPFELPLLQIADNSVTAPVDIPLPDGLPEGYLTVEDLTVKHLSTFDVKQLSVSRVSLIPLNYRATMDIEIPVLTIDADQYDLRFLVGDFTVFGKGRAKCNLMGGGVSGTVVVRPRRSGSSLFISIVSVNLRIYLAKLESQITGLLGGDEHVDAFINSFLEYVVPEAIKQYETEISSTLNTLIMEVGNEILADLDLISIFS